MRSSISDSEAHKSPQRPWARCVGFCVGGIVIAVLLNGYLARSINNEHELRYREIFSPTGRPSVIFIGSSTTAHGVNPFYLPNHGVRTYNLSLNGSGPALSLAWYRYILRRFYPKPETVVLGAEWMTLSPSMSRRLELDSEWFPRPLFWSMFFDPGFSKTELLTSRFPLYKERSLLVQTLCGRQYDRVNIQRYYRGFAPYEGVLNTTTARMDLSLLPVDRKQIEAFRELIRVLRQDGIRVILFTAPQYAIAYDTILCTEGQAVIQAMAQQEGVPYLDYNGALRSEINRRAENFIEYLHLNGLGAERFSRRLGVDLEHLGVVF